MRLDSYDTSERFKAQVVSNTRITPEDASDEVREIILDVDRDDLVLSAGQSLGVLAPGDPAFGRHQHLRLYTPTEAPEPADGKSRVRLCVKRCDYIDEYSGERYPGVASNFLCDLEPGDGVMVTGPYGIPFEVPPEEDASLVLIGAGTGIVPFRAFLKHLYAQADFRGRVLLFHGAKSGLELLYENIEHDDLGQYYDRETFEAINVLARRPYLDDEPDWQGALEARAGQLAELLGDPDTYVYVAGLESIRDALDRALAGIVGSAERWKRRKAELEAGGRWAELLY